MQSLTSRRDSRKGILPSYKTHKRKLSGDKTQPHRPDAALQSEAWQRAAVIASVMFLFFTWMYLFGEQTPFDELGHHDHGRKPVDGAEFFNGPQTSSSSARAWFPTQSAYHDHVHTVSSSEEV